MKKCSKCGADKPITEFSKDSRKASGIRPSCKVCNSEHKKIYYKNNKERISLYWKDFYQNNKDRLKDKQRKKYRDKLPDYLYYAAKDRSKKLGLEFNLDKNDIVIPEICPAFKQPFVVGDNDLCPSVDRIDATRGYVKGNIAVISFRANRLKNNATLEELESLVNYLREQKGKN
jgi:hypothetical protein